MSNVDYLGLRIDLERVEESLTERLARIEAEANPSQDAITVAAVERMLASKHQEAEDEDIEDDFAGGTAGIAGAPLMTWRSHLAELISRLREDGYEKCAAHLKRLADVNSLKKPFTAADEADVIKSILEYLAAFKREVKRPWEIPQDTADIFDPAFVEKFRIELLRDVELRRRATELAEAEPNRVDADELRAKMLADLPQVIDQALRPYADELQALSRWALTGLVADDKKGAFDERDYISFSAAYNVCGLTERQGRAMLKEHPEIKIHKPSSQRLSVHCGDWLNCCKELREKAFKAIDGEPDAITEVDADTVTAFVELAKKTHAGHQSKKRQKPK